MGLSKLAPDVGSNWPPLWKLAPDVGPAPDLSPTYICSATVKCTTSFMCAICTRVQICTWGANLHPGCIFDHVNGVLNICTGCNFAPGCKFAPASEVVEIYLHPEANLLLHSRLCKFICTRKQICSCLRGGAKLCT